MRAERQTTTCILVNYGPFIRLCSIVRKPRAFSSDWPICVCYVTVLSTSLDIVHDFPWQLESKAGNRRSVFPMVFYFNGIRKSNGFFMPLKLKTHWDNWSSFSRLIRPCPKCQSNPNLFKTLLSKFLNADAGSVLHYLWVWFILEIMWFDLAVTL